MSRSVPSGSARTITSPANTSRSAGVTLVAAVAISASTTAPDCSRTGPGSLARVSSTIRACSPETSPAAIPAARLGHAAGRTSPVNATRGVIAWARSTRRFASPPDSRSCSRRKAAVDGRA